MFKKLEGHTVLISATAISEEQMKLVKEIIAHNGGEPKIRRKDLKAAHNALRGRMASPYFIAKNAAIQVKGEHGVYDLSRFKLSTKKAAAPKPTAEEGAPKVKKAPKPKVKKAPKPKAKKEKVPKVEAPAANVESTELVPA